MCAAPALAQQLEQRVEISPFGGYRFGWSVGDVNGVPVVDDDGGVSFGVVVDVPLGRAYDDLIFEALFSREQARVTVQTSSIFSTPAFEDVEVDHLMIGVSKELDESLPRARAFISGLVGLTRFAAADDYEVRFSIGLAAGGKFFPTRHLGLRIEGRGYMTIIGGSGAAVCSGGCVFAFASNPQFQADLTAGVIFAF